MQRYYNWFRDKEGRGFPGAVVTVYNAGTTNLATLYNQHGSIATPLPIANPLATDSNGFFGFAVADGTYDIQMSGGGVSTVIMPNITIGDTTGGGSSILPSVEVEIDFGTVPVPSKSFTISDANITTSSKIDLTPSAKTAAGRVGTDDMEWDGLSLSAIPATGSMIVYAVANPGPVVGKRKIHYRVG